MEKMREEVRERGGERVRGRGVSGFFLGVSSGRQDRNFQVRDVLIGLETSNRFAPVDFRLVVKKGSLSHFVFLGVEEVVWLKSILEVSATNSWAVSQGCRFLGKRREVRLSSFEARGIRFLNVAERCRNGRQFFVNIPREENSEGWPSLLRVLTEITVEVVPPPPIKGQPLKSFAEIVRGPGLGLEGLCDLSEESVIEVKDVGVDDRLKYLERCLCFRFLDKKLESVNWKSFREWMALNWGLPKDARIFCLGDDLWMLECPSKESVVRVVSLNRCLFGATRVLLDGWTVGAGRSTLLRKQGAAWIIVRGIPLHLRSVNLFRSLGDRCGGFVDFDDSRCSLNAVRIKVSSVKVLPEELVLRHQGVLFSVKVSDETMEAGGRDSGLGHQGFLVGATDKDGRNSRMQWIMRCERGKAKFFEKGESSRKTSRQPLEGRGSSQANLEAGELRWCPAKGLGQELRSETARETEFSGGVLSTDTAESGMGPLGLSGRPQERVLPAGVVGTTVVRTGKRQVEWTTEMARIGGGRKKILCVSSHFGVYVGLKISDTEGLCIESRNFSVSQTKLLSWFRTPRFDFSVEPGRWVIQLGSEPNRALSSLVGPRKELVLGPSQMFLPETGSLGLSLSQEDSDESSPQQFIEEELLDRRKILSVVESVAQGIDLLLGESSVDALDSVRKTAVDVLDRRKGSKGKSRMDRELAKLGASMDSELIARPRERRSGKLKRMKEFLREWNREVFNRVEVQIAEVLRDIAELDSQEERGVLDEEARLERCRLKCSLIQLWKQEGGALSEYHEFLAFLRRIPMETVSEGPPAIVWPLTESGLFSVKSLKAHLTRQKFEGAADFPVDTIWSKVVPTKVQGFLWLSFHGRIATIDVLRSRGFHFPNRCSLCRQDEESVSHIFIHCPFVSPIWSKISSRLSIFGPLPDKLADLVAGWKRMNCDNSFESMHRVVLHSFVWHVWLERNDVIFRDSVASASRVFYRSVVSSCCWLKTHAIISQHDFELWLRILTAI
ncbi:Putative ribonuclease H protein At1g65750 [Linum perenne]